MGQRERERKESSKGMRRKGEERGKGKLENIRTEEKGSKRNSRRKNNYSSFHPLLFTFVTNVISQLPTVRFIIKSRPKDSAVFVFNFGLFLFKMLSY